jgi:Helicase
MIALQRHVAKLLAHVDARHAPPPPSVDPGAFFRAATGHRPDDWQTDALRSTAERMLLVCGRQTGKTLAAATIAVRMSQTRRESLTLIISPSLRQSAEAFRVALACYFRLPVRVPVLARSLLRVEFANGARILSLPGREGTTRGYAPDLLVIDEAARLPTETWHALSPSVAVSQGRILALSTPAGRGDNWFFQVFDADPSWEIYHRPSTECPRIPQEFLAREEGILPPWLYAQEYLAQFVENEGRIVFRPAWVKSSVAAGIEPFIFSWEQSA